MTTDTLTPAPAPALEPPPARAGGHPRRWLILFVVLAAECMDLLDGTVVTVAAPAIRHDLGASLSALQWIVGGYALTFAMFLIAGARLGDAHGRRRLFLLGTSGFVVASLLCGIAPTTGALVAARLAQGVCAAVMIPQGLGIIRAVFPSDEIGKAFAMFGPVMGLAAVCGPIIGGALVATGSWRWVFLVNLPVGLVALAGAIRVVPESRSPVPPRADIVGMVLVGAASVSIVYPLIQGREHGWPAWTFGLMALSAVLFGAFALHERRRVRRGRDPLVTPTIFARRAFTAGLVVSLVFFAGMMGVLLVTTLHLQLALGFSAIHAGLTLIPFSLGTAVGAGVAGGALAPRFGRGVLIGGLAVMAAGVAALIVTLQIADPATSLGLAPALALSGVGLGAVLAPMFDIILAGVADDEVGSASGVLNAVQQLAGALGIAALGTVFFSALPHAGSVGAFQRVLWIELAALAGAAALATLLPRHAREPAM